MFLVNKSIDYSDSRYTRVFDYVKTRKVEVLGFIDVMFGRGDVSDEAARNMGLEFVEEIREYVRFVFRDEERELDFFESTMEGASEDVMTYVREKRKVVSDGIRSVRRLVEFDERSVYVVLATGISYDGDIRYRESEFSEREFLMALPELRQLVDSEFGRELDLDEFSRVRMPLDAEGYMVEELLDVKIYYVDTVGNVRLVELV